MTGMLFAVVLGLTSALSGPRLVVDHCTVDVGLHPYYLELSHAFSLTNSGDQPLDVAVRRVTCGCTSHALSGDTIQPGGTAQLELGYMPKEKEAKSGPQSFVVELETNDPAQPLPILKLNVELVDHVHAAPGQMQLSAAAGGLDNAQTLDVFCMDDGTVAEITEVVSPGPWVSIEPLETRASPGAMLHRYRVAYAADGAGGLDGPIIVRTTSARVPMIEVHVTSGAPDVIPASPARVLFGVVKSEGVVEKEVALHVSKDGPIPHVCESSDPRVAVEMRGGDGEFVVSLKLTPRPVERLTTVKAEVVVLDEAGTRLCRVPVIATLAP